MRATVQTTGKRVAAKVSGCFARGAAALLAVLALSVGAAEATAAPAAGPSMRTGGVTSQPIGHYEFCQQHPRECRVRSRDLRPVAMSQGVWDAIVAVNARVNAAIVPVTDLDLHGVAELWSYPTRSGDCEDYALLKRNMLMQMGFAASDLLITVVRKPDGEGHAVLTVRTDHGDFVMDNLDPRVRHWMQTPYTFLKRQAEFHSGRWVDITGGAAGAVASVR